MKMTTSCFYLIQKKKKNEDDPKANLEEFTWKFDKFSKNFKSIILFGYYLST